MRASSLFFILLGLLSGTIGSQLEPSSNISTQQNSMPLKHKIVVTVQDERETNQENCCRTCNASEIGEGLRKEFQGLLSNHSSRMEQLEDATNQRLRNQTLLIKKLGQRLEDEVVQMDHRLTNQTFLIKKLSEQLEDLQSLLTCAGEPPSTLNGRPKDFERKHGSEVSYECRKNFAMTGNSTVRCQFGKWEGEPPLCTRPATSVSALRVHLNEYDVSNVSCFSEKEDQKIDFSRILDTGTGGALPIGAKTYSRGREAILDLTGVPNDDKRGVYECAAANHTGMTFAIGPYGYFSWPHIRSVGDTLRLGGWKDAPSYRWLHDGKPVPAWDGRGTVEIAGVGMEDAGLYEWYKEEDRRGTQWFYRIVVRECPADKYGELCDEECPACYNGGVCSEALGTCVCPTGFEGEHCEVACGENRVGLDCTLSCDGGDCLNQLFCQPDPYGCTCAQGYGGNFCGGRCTEGHFGASCNRKCHCKEGSCDPYTGACDKGCSKGWTGSSCQIPVKT